ncbi:hypothetical protein ACP275_09G024200 [Erythranthe tilingii]
MGFLLNRLIWKHPVLMKAPEDPATKKSRYSWSWRNHAIMRFDIRNQGNYETCWSTTTADAVSCKLKLRRRNTNPFVTAPQELIDRVYQRYDARFVHYSDLRLSSYASNSYVALDYIKKFGITLEADYPYKGTIQDKVIPEYPRVRMAKTRNLIGAKWSKIIKAIGKQPVIGRIDSCASFKKFRGSKIYRKHTLKPKEKYVVHVVLVVGYGKDSCGKHYYIIRNSWGNRWGDRGYAKVAADLITILHYPGDVTIDYGQ